MEISNIKLTNTTVYSFSCKGNIDLMGLHLVGEISMCKEIIDSKIKKIVLLWEYSKVKFCISPLLADKWTHNFQGVQGLKSV